MTDDAALLLSSLEAGVATLTLNRPSQRNALSSAMMAALQSALDRIRDDPAVRVAVIAAHGPAFCSGHDLKEINANRSPAFYRTLFAACSRLMTSILHLPQPVIARVHGVATAAGCQLVASCDLAIAADSARFATPGVNIGLFCSTPMVALTRNIGRKQAMEMLLTGEAIDAETACRFGLVNQAVPLADLERVTADLARRLASKSPLTLRIGKQAFYRQLELGVEDAYDYCSAVMTRNLAASDAAEGIDAFLNKRQPSWTGA